MCCFAECILQLSGSENDIFEMRVAVALVKCRPFLKEWDKLMRAVLTSPYYYKAAFSSRLRHGISNLSASLSPSLPLSLSSISHDVVSGYIIIFSSCNRLFLTASAVIIMVLKI